MLRRTGLHRANALCRTPVLQCSLDAGTVFSWGSNQNGQLGHSEQDAMATSPKAPLRCHPSAAAHRADRKCFQRCGLAWLCFALFCFALLGFGLELAQPYGFGRQPIRWLHGVRIEQLSAGESHSIARASEAMAHDCCPPHADTHPLCAPAPAPAEATLAIAQRSLPFAAIAA